jgi:hypothetical protein
LNVKECSGRIKKTKKGVIMFASMLYKAFKGGEKMFHVFMDNNIQDPSDYEKLAVELIKFAGELRTAIKAQEDAKVAQATPPIEAAPEVPQVEVSQP